VSHLSISLERRERRANGFRTHSSKRVSKYIQLADDFRRKMKAGELGPGQQLPSYAAMKEQHGIAQATLDQVYALLERDGLIIRTRGRGTFVAEPRRTSVAGVIGIVTPGASDQHPYYALTVHAIQDTAHGYGLSVLLLNDVSALKITSLDGVITYNDLNEIMRSLPPGTPKISLIQPSSTALSILADDYGGSLAATEYLLSLGHRRIGFLTGGCQSNADMASRQRLRGYQDGLTRAGITASPEWVRALYGPWTPRYQSDFRKQGYQKMIDWLDEGWADLGCTALMVQNDETAAGAVEALEKAGLRVPQDVSVVGFDGTPLKDHFPLRLTTVAVPLREIGQTAVEELGRLIEHPLNGIEENGGTHADIVLPARLRIGDTTAPPQLSKNKGPDESLGAERKEGAMHDTS
jgi:LacI family transcriptional regulator